MLHAGQDPGSLTLNEQRTGADGAAWHLVDIGANLAHESFDADIDAVIERAQAAGVAQIVVTGSCADSNLKARALAQRFRGRLFSTAGVHPHHAASWNGEIAEQIEELSQSPEVVSLGECGLDYFRNFSSPDDQRRAFTAQLDIAVRCGKPLFLHQRDAHGDFHAIIREYRRQLGAIVVHCFTDTQAAMEDYLALDCHIGITGWICDERRGAHLIDAVRIIPDDRLMIETDAPYLLPRTAPKTASRRNEPSYLPWVVRAIAAARECSPAQTAEATARTARRFFALD